MKLPYPIMFSFAIGVLSGFLPKYGFLLSSSRMLAFFPFFVLGYYAQTEKWFLYLDKYRSNYKAISIVILLCAFICSIALNGRFQTHFFYSKFYFEIGESVWLSLLLRIIAYSTALIGSLSFMSIIPKTKSIISLIGERSLYVFLLHSLILYVFVCSQSLSAIKNPYVFTGITLLGVFLTVFLSTDLIQRLTQPLVEPYTIWNLCRNRVPLKKW